MRPCMYATWSDFLPGLPLFQTLGSRLYASIMSEQIENVAPAIYLLTPSAVHDAIRDPCLGLRAVYVPVGPTPAVE